MYEKLAVELTKELITFESYSVQGKQTIMNHMYEKIKRETNANVQIFNANSENPYIIAHHSNGDGFQLLLHGHLDTVSLDGVENPLTPTERNGKLFGRGACDMKAGCASNYAAFKYACDHDVNGDVFLMFVSDEETFAQQTIDAFEQHQLPQCDLGVISEPTNQQVMVVQKGNAWIEVEFIGKSAHASQPELGTNAIYMAAEFILAFKQYTQKKYPLDVHPMLGQAVMNIGVIQGGVQANSVPSNCKIVIDFRYLPDQQVTQLIEDIHTVALQLQDTDNQFQYETKLIVDCPPMEVNQHSDKFLKMKSILEQELDKELFIRAFSGWGEGGTLDRYHVDTLYFGPGNSATAHMMDEYVIIQDIQEVTQGIIAIVRENCK